MKFQTVSEPGKDPEFDDVLWGMIPRVSGGDHPFAPPTRCYDPVGIEGGISRRSSRGYAAR